MTLCIAQGVTLGKNRRRCLELIATLWRQGRIFGESLGGIYSSPSCRAQRTIACTERGIIPNSVKIHRCGETNKTNLDTLEENSIDSFPEHWWNLEISDPTSPQGYSWVDGRFKKNASHIETRNDLTKCVVVCVEMCSKGSKAALGYWKTKNRAARQKEKFTMFLPTTLNNLRPFFRTPRIFGDFQWNQQCHQ